MVIENIFEAHGFDRIMAYSGSDITEQMIDCCFEIDKEFYEDEYAWDIEQIKNIVKSLGQFCFVYVDKDDRKPMGYSFWFPVKTPVFNEFIKSNEMLLSLIEEYCSGYKDSDHVNLFLGGEAFVSGYNIRKLHAAIEDLFQKRVLDLANAGVKVKYIAMESCCKYDEEFLLPKLGLTKQVKKDKSTFYYDEYSPEKVYKESKFANELKKYYK